MKKAFDNFLASSIQGIMKRIKAKGIPSIGCEQALKENIFFHSKVVNDLETFKKCSDVIIANRWHDAWDDVRKKVFTRAGFSRD